MWKKLAKVSLTHWIFIGLIFGFACGVFAPSFALSMRPLRGLFLNGIKSIIAPLIFATLVTGIAGTGSVKQLGRIGIKAMVYFEVVTTLALAVGLFVVNWLRPGEGLKIGALQTGTEAVAKIAGAQNTHLSFGGFLEHLLPSSIADAVLRGDVLQIVILSSLFALAVLMAGEKGRPIFHFCEALAEVMFRVTSMIMWLAPLGVSAAIAVSVAEHGWQVIVPLLKLIGTLYLALIIFLVFVLLPVALIAKIPVLRFLKQVKSPTLLAFATTSSESAYPMALENLERFGVPRSISSFVLPLGYSFNLDGSTLYLAVASIFVSQASGVPMSLGSQLTMMALLMLTTKGVAAVPRASLVVLSGALAAFHLPLEGVALILAVDEFMDMARTAVNLLGNCLATAVIARWEGLLCDDPANPSQTSA